MICSDPQRRVTLAVLVGSAWPYPYMRLMTVAQRLAYLVANCALAASSYSLGQSINIAIWGETLTLQLQY
jgi:hypothetical protein